MTEYLFISIAEDGEIGFFDAISVDAINEGQAWKELRKMLTDEEYETAELEDSVEKFEDC